MVVQPNVPPMSPSLPIHEKKDAIAQALQRHPVVVVSGDTGSGKTTQLPQICHEALPGRGLIGCTQPRRVAAVSLAKRVAEEQRVELGGLVGVQVRFLDQLSEHTRIKFMTDGILLAETRSDRQLRRYDVIIVDEAHERTLNIDFTLGYLRNLLDRREDLKVVISSATLDVERFSKFFQGAPIVEIEGRTFPVGDHYLPPEGREDLPSHVARAVDWVREKDRQGDILVFLPGEREIQEAADMLEGRQIPRTKILPLYARLSLKDQQTVFQSSPNHQRIVLATNVAETSITIPGIVYVIDAGLARISRYQAQTGIQRLLTERISKASAQQRRGRCGRVSEGVCVRLYDETDFEKRPAYTDPEIRRTLLAGVILQMKSLGLPPVESFPFIDPPQRRLVAEGYKQLQELCALDDQRQITREGREMARLPIDPSLAKMLLFAREKHAVVLPWMVVLVAALATQDPRERPRAKRDLADEAHRKWQHAKSDFMARLILWCDVRRHLDGKGRPQKNALRRFCHKHFLNYRRLMEWLGVARELAALLRVRRLPYGDDALTEGDYLPIHQSLLAGIPRGAAQRDEKRVYRTGGERSFAIFPGSGLFNQKKVPEWLLGFEIVETARVYARQVASIEPAWLEKAVPHMCKFHYSHPTWDAKQGAVYGREHVSCVGLRILSDRRVHLGRILPEEARRTFIWEGLVPGDLRTQGAFRETNKATIAAVKLRETKLRKAGSLFCEDAVFEFFDGRLPTDICTTKAFEKWRLTTEAANPDVLLFKEEDICYPQLTPFDEEDYPDEILHGELAYPVYYQFAPGELQDGITLGCSLSYLPKLPDWLGGWLVPSYLREKVAILLRSLSNERRQACGRIDDMASAFVAQAEPKQDLLEALAAYLTRQTGYAIAPADFNENELPSHLQPHYWIGDDDGKELASGANLKALRSQLAPKLAAWFEDQTSSWEQSGLTSFPETSLPESDALGHLTGFPALIDETVSVGVRCFPNREQAKTQHRLGLARLVELAMPDQVDYVRRYYPLGTLTKPLITMLGPGGRITLTDLVTLTIDATLGGTETEPPGIRDAKTFDQRLPDVRSDLFAQAEKIAGTLEAMIQDFEVANRHLEANRSGNYASSFQDVQAQLDDLFANCFLLRGWWPRLKHYPRYLRALRARIDRMLGSPPNKDSQKLERVIPFQKAYEERLGSWSDRPLDTPFALRAFGWQLQEFRVSVFTPEIGAATKVSEKRLSKALEALS